MVPDEAWRLLTEWLPANDDPERPQITLSTVDEDGDPDARTVLLTSFGPDGFLFNTDGASRKAAHIAVHPAVAMTVLWPGFTHQLVIRGTAAPAPADRVAAAYRSRSPYLQQLAWLNTHEFAELPRGARIRLGRIRGGSRGRLRAAGVVGRLPGDADAPDVLVVERRHGVAACRVRACLRRRLVEAESRGLTPAAGARSQQVSGRGTPGGRLLRSRRGPA